MTKVTKNLIGKEVNPEKIQLAHRQPKQNKSSVGDNAKREGSTPSVSEDKTVKAAPYYLDKFEDLVFDILFYWKDKKDERWLKTYDKITKEIEQKARRSQELLDKKEFLQVLESLGREIYVICSDEPLERAKIQLYDEHLYSLKQDIINLENKNK